MKRLAERRHKKSENSIPALLRFFPARLADFDPYAPINTGGVTISCSICYRRCILIHTPSMGRNRRIFDICTHFACCFVHYTNQRQHLAYSQFSGVYIINNPCERYGGFMCTLCSHSTVYLFISSPPFCMHSISHCYILPFSADEYRNLAFLFSCTKKHALIGLLLWCRACLLE